MIAPPRRKPTMPQDSTFVLLLLLYTILSSTTAQAQALRRRQYDSGPIPGTTTTPDGSGGGWDTSGGYAPPNPAGVIAACVLVGTLTLVAVGVFIWVWCKYRVEIGRVGWRAWWKGERAGGARAKRGSITGTDESGEVPRGWKLDSISSSNGTDTKDGYEEDKKLEKVAEEESPEPSPMAVAEVDVRRPPKALALI
ncbi:hypothetical protein FN846DRAFT_495088 [Sphaerosporella brunnea]|uniref:Uncharacterized protein n=1 Tax=Sphaerosporella brunnea TaxID=1250544 RepID=A0A5J5F3M6_9PEZI|nr:hypothetical protein FN846DRAFT_495088 [Sphaerosporella brunnea]